LVELLPLLADADLEMVFPEATEKGHAGFEHWYERVIRIFFDEVHTVKEVQGSDPSNVIGGELAGQGVESARPEEQVAGLRCVPDLDRPTILCDGEAGAGPVCGGLARRHGGLCNPVVARSSAEDVIIVRSRARQCVAD